MSCSSVNVQLASKLLALKCLLPVCRQTNLKIKTKDVVFTNNKVIPTGLWKGLCQELIVWRAGWDCDHWIQPASACQGYPMAGGVTEVRSMGTWYFPDNCFQICFETVMWLRGSLSSLWSVLFWHVIAGSSDQDTPIPAPCQLLEAGRGQDEVQEMSRMCLLQPRESNEGYVMYLTAGQEI